MLLKSSFYHFLKIKSNPFWTLGGRVKHLMHLLVHTRKTFLPYSTSALLGISGFSWWKPSTNCSAFSKLSGGSQVFWSSEQPFHLTKYLQAFAHCDREPSLYKGLSHSWQSVPLPTWGRRRSLQVLVEAVLFLLKLRFGKVPTAKHGRLGVSSM